MLNIERMDKSATDDSKPNDSQPNNSQHSNSQSSDSLGENKPDNSNRNSRNSRNSQTKNIRSGHAGSSQAGSGQAAGGNMGGGNGGGNGGYAGGHMGVRRARKHGLPINGWIILDKPIGLRSTAAVAKVQSLLRARKCGHAGTLDPAAEGLLPLALGAATKTVSYAMDSTKTYDIVVRWGERSNTDDSEGEIEETSTARPTREQIEAVLGKFIGNIKQRPPSFSALRIEGKRAYDLARQGEKVVLEPRVVRIESIKLVEIIDQNLARFAVESGKGAYMRAIARDLGEELGCCGRLESLRRKRVGAFGEKHAISLDELEKIMQSHSSETQAQQAGEEPAGEQPAVRLPAVKLGGEQPAVKLPAVKLGGEQPAVRLDAGEQAGEPAGVEVVASLTTSLITKLGHNLLPVEAVLADMQQLVLEPDEQKKFRQGQGLIFVSTIQRERVEHITEGQPVATFRPARPAQSYNSNSNSLANPVANTLPKLLGIGTLVKGRFKAERLLVENTSRNGGRNAGRSDGRSKGRSAGRGERRYTGSGERRNERRDTGAEKPSREKNINAESYKNSYDETKSQKNFQRVTQKVAPIGAPRVIPIAIQKIAE